MPLTKTPWHPLPLTIPNRSAPPLLLQSTFTSTTYTIHLTDLVNIWSESLSKREILARAERNSTTIDPSEDVSQLPILLEKLEYALGRRRDDDAVDLEIFLGKSGLRLRASIELPKPLGDLKWVFELKPVGGVELVNLLVLPYLSEVATLRDMVESLMTVVKEKDNVLERLVEGMGEAGVDVRTMVGGGRRRRGLEKFDVGRWRGEFLGGDRRAGEVVSEVFEQNSEKEIPGVKGLGGEAGEWWRGLDEDGGGEEKEKKPRKRFEPGGGAQEKWLQKPIPAKAAPDTDDDEFEVQRTPPRASERTPHSIKKPQSISPPSFRRKLKSPTSSRTHLAQDETASEDDDLHVGPPASRKLASPSISKSASPSKISPPPTKRVIGKIGGVRKITSPSPVLFDIPMADTEETGDEDDAWVSVNKGKGKERDTGNSDDIPPPRVVNNSVKMVIGGWKPTPELAHKEEKTATVKKTIGTIGKAGGRKIGLGENMVKDGDSAPSGSAVSHPSQKFEEASLNDFQSRVPTPPLIPPEESVKEAEDEDEDEKADRKRRQLEKELEAKKKVPVKKKRKF